MNDRRNFLRTVSAVSVAAAGWPALPACTPSGELDRAPEAPANSTDRLERIGVQLYTVRAAMRDDVAATLARVADIGYQEVEFAGYFDHTPADIRRMLDDNGLTAPAAHVPLEQLEGQTTELVDLAKTIGHEYLILAWLAQTDWNSVAALQRTADRFNRIGEALNAAGLKFAYHNHDFEFATVGSRTVYSTLLAECDPALVQFEMDLFWITKGGGDPMAAFAAHPGRFPCVHVKDMAADGAMVDVGAGEIDFAKLFAQRESAGVHHFFVEHDAPEDPFASITASHAALRSLRF